MKRVEQQVLVNVLDDLVADTEEGDYSDDDRKVLFTSAETIMQIMQKKYNVETQEDDSDRRAAMTLYYSEIA